MTSVLLPAPFLHRADLYALGHTPGSVRSLVDRGELHRVFRDVYATRPASDLSLEELCSAAQIYADDGLVFTCHTALALDGAPEVAGALHATAIDGRQVRSSPGGLVVHHFMNCPPAPATRSGHRVVARELAVVQAFGCLPLSVRGAYVLDLVQKRFIRPPDVAALVGPCTKGRPKLLDLLQLAEKGTHSLGELRMLQRSLRQASLPDPELQHRVVLPSGRVVYLDGAYAKAKVGIEYDGYDDHFTSAARRRDVARDAELAAAGWVIIRCTSAQLSGANARVFAMQVRAAVLSRGGF